MEVIIIITDHIFSLLQNILKSNRHNIAKPGPHSLLFNWISQSNELALQILYENVVSNKRESGAYLKNYLRIKNFLNFMTASDIFILPSGPQTMSG